MNGPAVCACGETFDDVQGTLHGQPAALWRLLEHQATSCERGAS